MPRILRRLGFVALVAGSLVASPSAAFDNPIIAFDNPIIAFDNPIIAFDNPIIAVKKPLIGKGAVVSFDNPIIAQELALMVMQAPLERIGKSALDAKAAKLMAARLTAEITAARARNAQLLKSLAPKSTEAMSLRKLDDKLEALEAAAPGAFKSPAAIESFRKSLAAARTTLAAKPGSKDQSRLRLALQAIELQRMHKLVSKKVKCTACWPAALPTVPGNPKGSAHISAANKARLRGMKAMGIDTGFPDVCREAIETALTEIAAASAKL